MSFSSHFSCYFSQKDFSLLQLGLSSFLYIYLVFSIHWVIAHFSVFSSVQSLGPVQLFVIPWSAACQASLSITKSQSLLKLLSIKSVMSSNHLILCCPLLLPPSTFPSIKVFSNESILCIRWPKYWSFSFSISSSNEYSGLMSFRIDWFHLLAVQGALKSLLQYHNLKTSILQCSVFFGPVLTSVCYYWRNHSFDYTDHCQQSDNLPEYLCNLLYS